MFCLRCGTGLGCPHTRGDGDGEATLDAFTAASRLLAVTPNWHLIAKIANSPDGETQRWGFNTPQTRTLYNLWILCCTLEFRWFWQVHTAEGFALANAIYGGSRLETLKAFLVQIDGAKATTP